MEKEDDKFKGYKVNPSLYELAGHLVEGRKTIRTKGTRPGKVGGKDEVIYLTEQVKTYIDTSPFIIVYKNSFDLIAELSANAQKVYFYCLKHLEYNRTDVLLVRGEIQESTKLSLSSISRGINELLDNEFLFKSNRKHFYFINLNIAHYGNRDEMYEEYEKTVLR
jgi:hypothetical protein